MVRTKANASTTRASVAKAPRKFSTPSHQSDPTSPSGTGSKKSKFTTGNSICPRPTPVWQKPINSFFSPVTRKVSEAQSEIDVDKEVHSDPTENTNSIEETFHDDKENQNPEDAPLCSKTPTLSEQNPEDAPLSSKTPTLSDEEAGPSNLVQKNPSISKRRRVIMFESDSDGDEDVPSTSRVGVAEMEVQNKASQ